MNRLDTIFIPFEESNRIEISQLKNNKISLTVPLKKIKGLIQPEESFISIPNAQFLEILSQKLFSTYPLYKENFTQWKLFILTEEIRKYVDEQLRLKISTDKNLRKVIICSIVDIKKYLEKTKKRYELNAFIWNDIEDRIWEENIISIKIEYDSIVEKRKILNEINCLVRKYDKKGFSIIIEIKKLI